MYIAIDFIGKFFCVQRFFWEITYSWLIVSNSVDSNFRLSRIFVEVPNFVVYKYI